MGKSSSPPAAPNYAELIPLQERSNLNQFNAMLGAQRSNSITPFGSQMWYRPGQAPGNITPFPSRDPRSPQSPPGGDGGQVKIPQPTTPPIKAASGPSYGSFPESDSPVRSAHRRFGGSGGTPPPRAETSPGVDDVYGDAARQGPWTFVQSLSPEQQWLYDQDLRIRAGQGDVAEGMIGRVQQEYANSPNFANLLPEYQQQGGPQVQDQRRFNGLDGSLQYSGGPFDRNRAEDAIYNRQMRFLEPQLQREESRAHQRLVSQGFDTRGDAYSEQMRNLSERQNAQRADAADRAILGGGQEASSELARILSARQGAQGERLADFSTGLQAGQQRFGQEAAAAQYGQSEQQRQLAQAISRINISQQDRARMMNELNAFRTGNQIQTPQVSPTFQTPNLAGIDQLGLAQQTYGNQLGAWNAQQASGDNFMSGLMGMAGTALGGPLGGMFGSWIGNQFGRGGAAPSDRRLKTNIQPLGKTKGGYNWYRWDWKDGSGSSEGVIAQEVPEASFVGPNGYLWVDYSKVH